jgi:nucleotide-binding universal stress UspA family protein
MEPGTNTAAHPDNERPRKIVVGIDGSAGAEAALRYALDEARSRGASLRIVGAWAIPSAAYRGAPLPAGFPDREETIAIYERLSGRSVPHVDFYEVYAAVRLSILMHRAGTLMVEVGLMPPESTMHLNNPASQLLARLIGEAAPTGESQSFIGNR